MSFTSIASLISSQPECILVSSIEGVCEIVLNRPDQRNALAADMVSDLTAAVSAAISDDAVRVILIRAAGDIFSAGGNLNSMKDRLAAAQTEDGQDPIALGNRKYGKFLEMFSACSKPTVVVVTGPAMGGGAGLVCAADIAIGSMQARFGFPEASIGLVPAQILPFVVGRLGIQHARRLMLTGERINADEALRLGLLDHLADSPETLEACVERVARNIVHCGPVALARTKELLRSSFGIIHDSPENLSSYLDQASHLFAQQMRTEAVEGVAAVKEKRKPDWAGYMAAQR